MLDRALARLSLGGLLFTLLLSLVAPVQAQVNVSTEVRSGPADETAKIIETGMSVHTGDAIRFTLRNATDAYVYLIVIGSSGTARVLQPLSGKPADAWMAAGEVRHIPADGDFLPIDKQPGPERVVALSATAPVPNLSRLLVRLEDAAPDVERLQRVLDEGGVVAQILAFNHLHAPAVAKSSGLQTGTETVMKKPVVKADSEPADVAVLGGLGSRISAFQADRPLPKQLGAEPTQQIEQIQPFQSETGESNAGGENNTDQNKGKAGLGSSIASWFGLGDKADTTPQQQAETEVEPADTYPLQAEVKTPTPKVLDKSAEVSALNPIPESVPNNGKSAKQVVMVEPEAVEKTLQEDAPAPAPETDVSDDIAGSTAEPEISENGRTAGLLASLFGPSTVVQEQQASAEATNQPVPVQQSEPEQQSQQEQQSEQGQQSQQEQQSEQGQQSQQEQQSEQEQQSGQEQLSRQVQQAEQEQQSQQVQQSEQEQQSQQVQQTEREQPAQNSSRPLVERQAEVNEENVSVLPDALTDDAADTTNASNTAGDINSDSKAEEQYPVEKETGSGLFGWLSGGSTNDPVQPEVTVTGEQSTTKTVTANEVKHAPASEVYKPEADSADEKQTDAQDSGLFGWLSGGSTNDPIQPEVTVTSEQSTTKTVTANEVKHAPASEVPKPEADSADEKQTDAQDGGLFGWLSGASTNDPAQPEVSVTSEQSATKTVTANEVKHAPASEVPKPEADSSDEKQTDAQDSGLFGWLLDSKTEKAERSTGTQDEDKDEPVAPAVQEATVEEPEPKETKSIGIFAGLGALFGSDSEVKNKIPQAQEKTALPAAPKPLELVSPTVVAKSASTPAMTRRKNEQGVNVTVLSGPKIIPEPGKNDAGKRNGQVLSAQGSRISALLEPQSEVAPENVTEPEPAVEAETVQATTEASVAAEPAEPVAVPQLADNAQQVAQVDGSTSSKESSPQINADAVVEQPTSGLNATPKQAVEVASPLVLNQKESEQNVTQLALNSAPAQAVKSAASVIAEVDLSDDKGLAGAVVLIVSAYGSGAGVVINDSGQVLTNWHLVAGLDRVAIAYKQEGEAQISKTEFRSARVLRHNKFPDLALLAVEDPKSVNPGHIVAKKSAQHALLKRGKRLHTLSLSENGALQPTVAAIRRVRVGSSWYSEQRVLHRATVIRADMEGDSALSGMPLFDESGAIQGLTTQVKADKNKLIAVSSHTLKEFLAKTR